MAKFTTNSYDEMPYGGDAHAQTHPRHLATLGTLFGMSPAPIGCCRVLELGCAEGGNLIPMAVGLPGSEFVGVELSQWQTEIGCEIINALGLENVRLLNQDLRDVDAAFGQFDYIIVHGLYSWVPDEVRPKTLSICKQNLKPDGIAYVSYNTYPGGHLRQMVRGMMLFHARRAGSPHNRVSGARSLLDFLIQSVPQEHGAYRAVLDWELKHIAPFSDSHVRHDILEDDYAAFFFCDFIERAEADGLQYLGDAEFTTMVPRNFSPDVFESLKGFSQTIVELEQYMDFLRNRTFRGTLLCHQGIALNHSLTPDCVSRFHIASELKPVSTSPDICLDRDERFCNSRDGDVKTNQPVTKAALTILAEIWPQNVPFDTLATRARERIAAGSGELKTSPHEDARMLSDALLKCFANGLVQFDVSPVSCRSSAGERPTVNPLVRWQANRGPVVTTQRHQNVKVADLSRWLLQEMDGTRDRDTLLERLTHLAVAGQFVLEDGETVVRDQHRLRKELADRLDVSLDQLARAALLID